MRTSTALLAATLAVACTKSAPAHPNPEEAPAEAAEPVAQAGDDQPSGEPADEQPGADEVDERLVPDAPGAPSYAPALGTELEGLVRERHPETAPRTHHLRDDGRPVYSNRLAFESSPYLRQHAHNPVGWFPWGEEAFALARELDRPIFLSVGYSTCHWCHVMEEESFEDVEIATLINSRFVPIKVDREQRPDVDDLYMTAVQLFAGRGGWPMTVVMTPDGEPFFGATYIPARDGDRGSRTGLLTVLGQLDDLYQNDREAALERAGDTAARLARATRPAPPGDLAGAAALSQAAAWYDEHFDETWGGIGNAPKFPQPSRLRLLMRVYRRTAQERLLRVVTETLDAMLRGGIYDQVGGGFHRYSTDARWLVPHFEKMLYDNAQLAVAYTEGWQLTGRDDFARIARETLDYVAREMQSADGGFYSATDADSEGEEGRFFVWTPDQLREALSDEQARLAIAYWGVTERGNFEHGTSILHVTRPLDEVAAELGIAPDSARQLLAEARQRLYELRAEREPPGLDDKILTAWNGLMIGAFARAGLAFDDERYREIAARAARSVRAALWHDGRLGRSFREGRRQEMGIVDDYAFLIAGVLDLFEATGDEDWLRWAIEIQAALDAHFTDSENGGYFLTADDAEELLVRQKVGHDGALPSGNSVAAENLQRLAELTSEERYRATADGVLRAFGRGLERRAIGYPRMLMALDFRLDRPREVILVEPPGGGDASALLDTLGRSFLPNRVVVPTTEGAELAAVQALVPLVEYKVAQDGQVTAYVCEAGVCERPTSDPAVFAEQIGVVVPYETP